MILSACLRKKVSTKLLSLFLLNGLENLCIEDLDMCNKSNDIFPVKISIKWLKLLNLNLAGASQLKVPFYACGNIHVSV